MNKGQIVTRALAAVMRDDCFLLRAGARPRLVDY
jgi:hypothetical protein